MRILSKLNRAFTLLEILIIVVIIGVIISAAMLYSETKNLMTSIYNTKSFTLMEIIVVIIILGILVSFGIPKFNKVLDRSYEKDAISNLKALVVAEQIYNTGYGTYWPTDFATHHVTSPAPADINQSLRLNIIENKVAYRCIGVLPVQCDAVHSPWTVTVKSNTNNFAPYCSGGICPTCTAGGCP